MITNFKLFESNSSRRFLTGTAAKEWCRNIGIENFTVNSDGTVDVGGDVSLRYKKLNNITIRFGTVDGTFDCAHNAITSLEGVPRIVRDGFWCNRNELKTLDGGPETVHDGWFNCSDNELRGTAGIPRMDRCLSLDLTHNELASLTGLPGTVHGDVHVDDNRLWSLEGCPDVAHGYFYCGGNPLETAYGLPKYAKHYFLGSHDFLMRCASALKTVPKELRLSLPRDAVYSMAIKNDPNVERYFFPDGMPKDINTDDINSISDFL